MTAQHKPPTQTCWGVDSSSATNTLHMTVGALTLAMNETLQTSSEWFFYKCNPISLLTDDVIDIFVRSYIL